MTRPDVRYLEVPREEIDRLRARADEVEWLIQTFESRDEGGWSRTALGRSAWMTGHGLKETWIGWALKFMFEEGVFKIERQEQRKGKKVRVVRGERYDDPRARASARTRVRRMKENRSSAPTFSRPEPPKPQRGRLIRTSYD
ncbi:MAG: hypothetical protein H0U46_01675 [Actinobacteria bacterium]|nr:hypothetical protein [Actinomycetota bacterium]